MQKEMPWPASEVIGHLRCSALACSKLERGLVVALHVDAAATGRQALGYRGR